MSPSPADLLYPPTQNGLQKSLGAALDVAAVTSVTLNNTTGIQNKKGIFLVDRIDTSGTEKDSSYREYITFDNVSGSTLTGLTRGLGGTTDQDHATGAIVEFIPDVVQQQALIDTLLAEHGTDGTHDPRVIAKLNDTQTFTNKTISTASNTLTGAATLTGTQTLTNKRITPRIVSTTDDATAVIDCDVTDEYVLTAVANATTFTVTGTPTNGQKLIIRFKDAGVAKDLTFTGFTAVGVTLPTTTVASKTHYVGAVYNSAASTWDVLAVAQEA
jgi:hypothetical protein